MTDWQRKVPHLIAVGRVAFGAGLMVAPGLLGRSFLGADASRPKVRFLSRMFGGRDLAVGVVLLRALRDGSPQAVNRALLLGAGCDAWDATAAWRGRDVPILVRLGVGATAAAAAAAGVAAALAPAPSGPVEAP